MVNFSRRHLSSFRRNKPSISVTAGSGRFISDIDSRHKNKTFFISTIFFQKSILNELTRYFFLVYMKELSQLRAARRLTRSQKSSEFHFYSALQTSASAPFLLRMRMRMWDFGADIRGCGCGCPLHHYYPPGNKLLGRSFQKARRAFWGEARKGFDVHWCVCTNGHRSPCGFRDARKGICVQ